MNEDKPYELPAPSSVANMCAAKAWCEDCDDQSRLLHEMSADTIRLLMKRCVHLAAQLERAECGK
jgi:hypothetical protein